MDTRSQPVRIIEVTHRSVLAIAVPMTLGYVTTPLLGLTDTAVIGRTGEAAALAGLAIAAALFDLLFGSLNFLRASTTALVAQAQGRGDGDELFAVFWRSMALSVGFGLLILALSPLIISGGPQWAPKAALRRRRPPISPSASWPRRSRSPTSPCSASCWGAGSDRSGSGCRSC
jgi:Na+-driven multidrug efflux pump